MSGPVVQPASGWLPDPTGRHQHRYWNGTAWTSAVADAGVHSEDPPQQWGQPTAGRPDPPPQQANEASKANGTWTTMSVVVTAIAGLITAVTGIFVATRGSDTYQPEVRREAANLGIDQNIGSGTAYRDFVQVQDDSGTVVVEVPVEWADVDGSPFVLDDGTGIAMVSASPDLAAMYSGYDVPGVEVSATDTSVVDVPTAMALHTPVDCTSVGGGPYNDSAFSGEIQFFGSCGGTNAVYMTLAASYRSDPSQIAIVRAQIISDADLEAIDQILATFNFR